jgi:hypothetical protein
LHGKLGFGFDLYMDRYSTLSVWICVGIKASLLNFNFLQSHLFTMPFSQSHLIRISGLTPPTALVKHIASASLPASPKTATRT